MPLNNDEKAKILNQFLDDSKIEAIQKINISKRITVTKEPRRYEILTSNIPHEYLLKEMKSRVEADANEIINLIVTYISSPLTVDMQTKIHLYSFDNVTCFNYDPIENTVANKLLNGTRGIYVFVMSDNYSVQVDFDDAIKGSPRRDKTKNIFKKGEILYIGKTDSFLTRMHQHFATDSENNKTGAIKLNSPVRNGLLGKIIIYAFQIKKDYKQLYEMIGTRTEKMLHNHFTGYILGNK